MGSKRIKRLIACIVIGAVGVGVASLLGGCDSAGGEGDGHDHRHYTTVSEP